MINKIAEECRHIWDVLTVVWTKEGQRAYPCRKCSKLLVFGTVAIKKA